MAILIYLYIYIKSFLMIKEEVELSRYFYINKAYREEKERRIKKRSNKRVE
jgi:hypothetical protein